MEVSEKLVVILLCSMITFYAYHRLHAVSEIRNEYPTERFAKESESNASKQ